MSVAIITTIIIAFFGALLVASVTVAGFFVVRWIKGLDGTAKTLATALTTLTEAVTRLDHRMDLIDRDIKGHSDDLMELKSRSCGTPGCPFYDPDKTPVPRSVRTRAADFGDAYGSV